MESIELNISADHFGNWLGLARDKKPASPAASPGSVPALHTDTVADNPLYDNEKLLLSSPVKKILPIGGINVPGVGPYAICVCKHKKTEITMNFNDRDGYQ
ncbi:unnamed protein product [Parnassius apollo]|uniref:(apollo) hypothetical protein n=1 Tax=Parnassius apollo TaxID=110799 RepID=A0A8S3XTU7_PARAO|nr:unnamed protein product [Parnassius apollo]